MTENEVIKNVLLEELGVNNTKKSADDVIRVYEKRYGNRVSNWPKLRQDLKTLLNSNHSNKNLLGRAIIKQVLEKGLNHIYISPDKECKDFRKILFKTRKEEFMQRVYQVFN
jgi:hypothetical protein